MALIDDINNTLIEIINTKKNEIDKLKEKGIFDNINFLEGNAIGQIGETFIQKLCENNNINHVFVKNTHDEYDLKINDKLIEIKTARKGLKTNTLQFDGLHRGYKYNYIILIGLKPSEVRYLIIEGRVEDKYHSDKDKRGFYLENVNGKERKLTNMSPNDKENFKLTITDFNQLKQIENIINDLKKI